MWYEARPELMEVRTPINRLIQGRTDGGSNKQADGQTNRS